MSLKRYVHLLRVRGVSSLLVFGMLARLPHSALGMLLMLHLVLDLEQDWGRAGLAVAVMTTGIAIGAPWRGQRVDVWGLRRALLPSIVLETAVWCTVPHVPLAGVYPLAFIGGLFMLPAFSVVRTGLGILTSGAQRRSAFALDAMGTELVFIIGPASAGLIATGVGTTIGLSAVGILSSLAGLALFLLNPPMRSEGVTGRTADVHEERLGAEASFVAAAPAGLAEAEGELILAGRKSARAYIAERGRKFKHRFGWISASVLAVLIAAAGAGMLLAGSEVGILAALEHRGVPGELGLVFLFWCGASMVGGLVYGTLDQRLSPLLMLLAMAILTIPMYFATDTWTLALLTIPPGLLCAPTLSAASEWLTDLVEEKRRGEAMGWYGSAATGGQAMGSPLTGALVDAAGAPAGFAGIGLFGVLIVAAALIAQQVRRRRARSARQMVP